jgi:hypothetical protein
VTSQPPIAARLKQLESMLAHTASPGARPSEFDAADVHLNSVLVDRIRQLTDLLRGMNSAGDDALGALTLRLLLNEYRTAVAHLRSVAQMAANRVDAAPRTLKDAHRALHRYEKQRGKSG